LGPGLDFGIKSAEYGGPFSPLTRVKLMLATF